MFENIRLSLQGILSHKIRSFLTMLGIIIGIAAIIAIVSTIEGTKEQIKENLIGAGNNTVTISLKQGEQSIDFMWETPPDNLRVVTEEQKERILEIPEVTNCTLLRTRSNDQNVFYMNHMIESATIVGIDEDTLTTMGYDIVEGINFTPEQFKSFAKVALVDTNFANTLFNGETAVGKVLEIHGEPFTIVGVITQRSNFEPVINTVDDFFMYSEDQGGKIAIPEADWGICFRYDEPQNMCVVKAVDTDSMTQAGKKTADILNENIKTVPSANSEDSDPELANIKMEYKSDNLLEQAKALQDLSKSTNSMLIWIASISLLVGGIGVMNIMLVSVTERTREIGLKKALGARRRRILSQFLTEAVVLTSIGGLLGVLFGIGLAQIIAKIAEVPVSISSSAIAISVIFSMAVGIVFGLIPSIKAANLNPIDALRYE